MSTVRVEELLRLAEPLPGDSPAGLRLRFDRSNNALYVQLKGLVQAASDESSGKRFGPAAIQSWQRVREECLRRLRESKDLEIACWLAEAMLITDGYGGLRDALRLINTMVDHLWDVGLMPDLFPSPDDPPLSRLGAITRLLGSGDSTGSLTLRIGWVPLTSEFQWKSPSGTSNQLRLCYEDYRRAEQVEGASPERKPNTPESPRDRLLNRGAPSMDHWDSALLATPVPELQATIRAMEEAIAECDHLYESLQARIEKAAPPPDTERLSLDKFGVAKDLRTILETVKRHMPENAAEQNVVEPQRTELPPANAPVGTVEVKPGRPAASAPPTGPWTRAQAIELMQDLASYFQRSEPHSPIAAGLARLVRWAKLDASALWHELLEPLNTDTKKSATSQLEQATGLKVHGLGNGNDGKT